MRQQMKPQPERTGLRGPRDEFPLQPPNNGGPQMRFSRGGTWSDLCLKKITWAARGHWICRRADNGNGTSVNQLLQRCRQEGRVIKTKEDGNKSSD